MDAFVASNNHLASTMVWASCWHGGEAGASFWYGDEASVSFWHGDEAGAIVEMDAFVMPKNHCAIPTVQA
jgi:hypothetical protein